ncbi:MAG: YeeE/YedE thiosulfate transporter family protein [Alphaproteobacteria bacterium]
MSKQRITAGIAGLLFGLGLALSQMTDPAKVLGFLTLGPDWDPSLALVMAGALMTTFIGYRLTWRRKAPLLGSRFHLPTNTRIDRRLVIGAALFGLGWGLVGLCPGPALAGLPVSLLTGAFPKLAAFVAAMIAAMLVTDRLARR